MSEIDLKCEKCGIDYQKPSDFKKWNDEWPNIFFKWSLSFCDTCRREKEIEALKSLPDVLKALSNNQPISKTETTENKK